MLVAQSIRRNLAVLSIVGLSVAAVGCGKGSSRNPTVQGVKYSSSIVDNKMLLALTLENLQLDVGIRVPIGDKMPNSYVGFEPGLTGGTVITFAMDINDLVILTNGAVNTLPPLTLPGGRPLPGIAEGFLPGIALSVPVLKNTVFYFNKNVFGVFVPLKLQFGQLIGTFRFYDDLGNPLGIISIVGQDANAQNSGLLFLIRWGQGSQVQTYMSQKGLL